MPTFRDGQKLFGKFGGFHVIGYVLVAGWFFIWMNRVLQISFDFFEFLMDFEMFVSK